MISDLVPHSVDLNNKLLVLATLILAVSHQVCPLLSGLADICHDAFQHVHQIHALSVFQLFGNLEVLDLFDATAGSAFLPAKLVLVLALIVRPIST